MDPDCETERPENWGKKSSGVLTSWTLEKVEKLCPMIKTFGRVHAARNDSRHQSMSPQFLPHGPLVARLEPGYRVRNHLGRLTSWTLGRLKIFPFNLNFFAGPQRDGRDLASIFEALSRLRGAVERERTLLASV